MVLLADYLAQKDVGRASAGASGPLPTPSSQAVPPRLRELVEAQLERLPIDEQRVLEVASVAGTEFAVASLAAEGDRWSRAGWNACARRSPGGASSSRIADWPGGPMGRSAAAIASGTRSIRTCSPRGSGPDSGRACTRRSEPGRRRPSVPVGR